MAIYTKWVALHEQETRAPVTGARIWSFETDGTSPDAQLQWVSTGVLRFAVDSTGGTRNQSVTLTPNVKPGDTVEALCIMDTDLVPRIYARVNGGAVFTSASSAFSAAYDTWSAWTSSFHGLNSATDGVIGLGANLYVEHKIVDPAGLDTPRDGTANDNLMDEVAGLWLSADGRRVSNTVLTT